VLTSRSPKFLASDFCGRQRSLVESAEKFVSIFTPQLDGTLLRLLMRASVNPEGIQVITDLRPNTGALDPVAQLRAGAVQIRHGLELRTLTPLHAKMLLVDEARLVAGSHLRCIQFE
jgi:hypothetical protein